MIAALLLVPLVAAALVWRLGRPGWNCPIVLAVAVLHAAFTGSFWVDDPAPLLDGWIGLDAVGRWFLTATSVLNLATAAYTIGYLGRDRRGDEPRSRARFCALHLTFLATLTLAALCRHFELLWIAIEATTLASAPLIYFHRSRHALEATWKYLVLCSVGIGLALLGTVFLGIAASAAQGGGLGLDALTEAAPDMDGSLVRLAFVFLVVGYGTKAGLAPMHTWLPDAHSEAPSPVSALLSGASLNCAVLGIVRVLPLVDASGGGPFARGILVALGLASLLTAAVFTVGQRDYKRLLAYSSVEHMGIVALGLGIGGVATQGALLHALGHSLVKGMLFLVSGNLLSTFHTKKVDEVRGALRRRPASGSLWLVGLFLATGAPPSPLFVSELAVLKGAIDSGQAAVAVAFLAGISIVFVGMASAFLPMALGEPSSRGPAGLDDGRDRRDTPWLVVPPAALAVALVVLGAWLPGPVARCLEMAARIVTGGNG